MIKDLEHAADDYLRLDLTATPIEIPTSGFHPSTSYTSRKDVSDAVAGRKKKNKVTSGWKPTNTLNNPSTNSIGSLALTNRIYKQEGSGTRLKGLDHERPQKRRKVGGIEATSDSDEEDVLSKGVNNKRLSGPKASNHVGNPPTSRESNQKRPRLYNEYSTQEFSVIEQLTSFQPNGGRRKKPSTLFASHLDNQVHLSKVKTTRQTASSARKEGNESLETLMPNHQTVGADSKSPYFSGATPSKMGYDTSTAIEVDDPVHAEVIETPEPARGLERRIPPNDMDASPDEISLQNRAPLENEASKPKISYRKLRTAVMQGNDQSVKDHTHLSEPEVSGALEDNTINDTRFPIHQYATDHQPKLCEGTFCLVFDKAQFCLDMFCDKHNVEPSLIPIDRVQRLCLEESHNATKLYLKLSKRQEFPSTIALTCTNHRVFRRLREFLEQRSNHVTSWPAEKMDRVFSNLRASRQSATEGGNPPADIDFIKEKRKRELDKSDETEEIASTKKPKLKLRDQMMKPPEPKQDVDDHDSASRSTKTSPGAYSTEQRSLDNPQTEIDAILKSVKPNPRRAGLRGSSSNTDHIFESETFPDRLRHSVVHGLGPPWKRPLTYPQQGKRKTNVEFDDLPKLDEGQCLNDSIIDFYLRYLVEQLQEKSPQMANRVYFFNTYFHTSLKGSGSKINYNNVKKWTRNIDLFCYDYVVVPINESYHWYIAIICNLPSLNRKAPKILGDSDEEPSILNDNQKGMVSDTDPMGNHGKELPIFENKEIAVTVPVTETTESQEDMPVHRPEESTRKVLSELRLDDDDRMKSVPEISQPFIHVPESSENPESSPSATITEVEVTNQSKEGSEHPPAAKKPHKTSKNNSGVQASSRKGKRKSIPRVYDPDVPAIITLDSLGLTHAPAIKALKLYLVEEAREKRGGMTWEESDIQGMTAKGIPQQSNYCDCGLYLLGYMDKFIENPKEFVTSLLRKEYDEARDWPQLRPSEMRSSVRTLIQSLHDIQESDRTAKPKKLPRASDTQPEAKADLSRPKTPQQASNKLLEGAVCESEVSEQRTETSKIVNAGQQQYPASALKGTAQDASTDKEAPAPLTHKEALASDPPLEISNGDDGLLNQISTAAKTIPKELTESIFDSGKDIVMVPDSQETLSQKASNDEFSTIRQGDVPEARAKSGVMPTISNPAVHQPELKHGVAQNISHPESDPIVEVARSPPGKGFNKQHATASPNIRGMKSAVGATKRDRSVQRERPGKKAIKFSKEKHGDMEVVSVDI